MIWPICLARYLQVDFWEDLMLSRARTLIWSCLNWERPDKFERRLPTERFRRAKANGANCSLFKWAVTAVRLCAPESALWRTCSGGPGLLWSAIQTCNVWLRGLRVTDISRPLPDEKGGRSRRDNKHSRFLLLRHQKPPDRDRCGDSGLIITCFSHSCLVIPPTSRSGDKNTEIIGINFSSIDTPALSLSKDKKWWRRDPPHMYTCTRDWQLNIAGVNTLLYFIENYIYLFSTLLWETISNHFVNVHMTNKLSRNKKST